MVRRATVAALKYTILSESNSVLFRFDVWKNGFKVELGERRTFMIFPDQVQTLYDVFFFVFGRVQVSSLCQRYKECPTGLHYGCLLASEEQNITATFLLIATPCSLSSLFTHCILFRKMVQHEKENRPADTAEIPWNSILPTGTRCESANETISTPSTQP